MNPKQYLSTYMYDGERFWTVIAGALPVCAATTDKDDAITVFRTRFPKSDMPVWNGDIGKFVTLEEIP